MRRALNILGRMVAVLCLALMAMVAETATAAGPSSSIVDVLLPAPDTLIEGEGSCSAAPGESTEEGLVACGVEYFGEMAPVMTAEMCSVFLEDLMASLMCEPGDSSCHGMQQGTIPPRSLDLLSSGLSFLLASSDLDLGEPESRLRFQNGDEVPPRCLAQAPLTPPPESRR